MPLYEYSCEKCGERTEVIQKFSDEPLTICTSCNGPLRKLISSPAIQFKGSGFYITDYAKSGKDSGSTEGSSSEKSSKPASESKASEPKPKTTTSSD